MVTTFSKQSQDYKNKNLYKILQVSPDASMELITSAYRILAEKYHPNSPEADLRKLSDVNYAFEVLCNPLTRKEYDDIKKGLGVEGLPPVFPVLNKPPDSLQSLINLVYENINFESVNHNPTKSRIYQEIYDEIIRKRHQIENSEPKDNPIWKILKAYKNYLSEDEFQSLVLVTTKILKVKNNDAKNIINKTAIDDVPFKKIYLIVGLIFITAIFAIIVAYMLITNNNRGNTATIDQQNTLTTANAPVNNQEFVYFARIANVGTPANIRSAPSTEWDNKVGRLNPGEIVEIISHKPNGWYLIKKDQLEGFIYGGLLESNDYPDAFPVGQIIPGEIKVFDKNKKLVNMLRDRDRLIIFYQTNENYYMVNEKGKLVSIKKENVLLENQQKTEIPYIDDRTKDTVELTAVKTEQIVIEDVTEEELLDDTDSHLIEEPLPKDIPENGVIIEPEPKAIPELNNKPVEQESVINPAPIAEPEAEAMLEPKQKPAPESIEDSPVLESKPTIIFPGTTSKDENAIEYYLSDLKISIVNNWVVPEGLKNYSTIVSFRVGKNGELKRLEMVRSSGNNKVDKASIKAIKSLAPFRPLPTSYHKDFVDIEFNFDNKL